MAEEIETLFTYKGRDVLIKRKGKGYIIGIRNKTDIWFDSLMYNSLRLARTSGKEYARIVIDKMIVSKKKEATAL